MRNLNIQILFTPLLVAFMAVTGCTAAPPRPNIMDSVGGIKIYSSTSDLQFSFLKERTSNEYFCDSRPSDVADTSVNNIGLSASTAGAREGIVGGSSRGAIDLGGRSPAVLITREMMYRACEMIMNLHLNKKEALELYMETLSSVVKVAKFDSNSGNEPNVSSTPTPALISISTQNTQASSERDTQSESVQDSQLGEGATSLSGE